MKTFLFAVLAALVVVACSEKTAPETPVAPVAPAVVVAPQAAPVTAVAQTDVVSPTPVANRDTKVVETKTTAPAKTNAKRVSTSAEKAAYAKAKKNATRAACLRKLVDQKIDGDVKAGQWRDFGNVLKSKVCA
jgi:uncharacterized protein YcfL